MSGRLYNLTDTETATLKEFYIAFYEYLDQLSSEPSSIAAFPTNTTEHSQKELNDTSKSLNLGFLNLRKLPKFMQSKGNGEVEDSSVSFNQLSGPAFRREFFAVNQFDHPDELMLRFLRARKWDIKESLRMLTKAIHWFHNADIARIKRVGETEINMDFMKKGETYFQGCDREGRPICHINLRLHDPKAQSIEIMQSFALLFMETSRLLFTGKVDSVAVLLNLTDSTMANIDYAAVKFLISVLEKDYPESLGIILLLNAPWFFSGVWKIISAMLDPVVAEKVKFVSVKELPEYIDPTYLPESLGGTMKQEFVYVPPHANENLKLEDSEGQRIAQKHFDEAIIEFEAETRLWATSTSPSPKREEAAAKLKAAYIELDSFIRSCTVYHRLGVIRGIEDVDWSRLKA